MPWFDAQLGRSVHTISVAEDRTEKRQRLLELVQKLENFVGGTAASIFYAPNSMKRLVNKPDPQAPPMPPPPPRTGPDTVRANAMANEDDKSQENELNR